ncbi:MAG: peptide deformylase [Phycisphaerales bacterium]|nr:peptide deformylase [Planctomycetota bacterium]
MPVNAANLSILHYPEKALRTPAKAIPKASAETRQIAERMIELMYEAEGIGLAAPQVGLSIALFVLDVPKGDKNSPESDPPSATSDAMVFINPKLTSFEGAPEPYEEGCLSLPDIRGDVLRPPIVTVQALDIDNKPFTLRASGLLARCIQHEFDHLQGVLILDKMTQMSRLKNRTAVRDLEREGSQKK